MTKFYTCVGLEAYSLKLCIFRHLENISLCSDIVVSVAVITFSASLGSLRVCPLHCRPSHLLHMHTPPGSSRDLSLWILLMARSISTVRLRISRHQSLSHRVHDRNSYVKVRVGRQQYCVGTAPATSSHNNAASSATTRRELILSPQTPASPFSTVVLLV
jgi:hypothetical protein